MHSRNPYRVPIDFSSLTAAYPALRPYILQSSSGPKIDYQNEAALRKLTEALLFRDFRLAINIPDDRLCPPVPNRLNYILWLEDVMGASALSLEEDHVRVTGIDIGTGASAIYPLLGCRTNAQWNFITTELDESSMCHALSNVHRNSLQDRITVVKAERHDPLLLPLLTSELRNKSYDFTMCNPPFYESRDEILRSAEAKKSGPSAVCTGADVEMITTGGESAFVCQMVSESQRSGNRCRWYTSMLGKVSSLTDVVNTLREHKIVNYAITEFIQGQTRRWAIGWSFTNVHLPDMIARISNPTLQSIMPLRNTLRYSFKFLGSRVIIQDLLVRVGVSIDDLYAEPTRSSLSDPAAITDILVRASGNTWSRAARRKKLAFGDASMRIEEPPQLICRLRCLDTLGVVELIVDWVQGDDRGLFESFSNHVWRKLEAALASQSQTQI